MTSLDLLPCQRDCYLREGQARVLRWGLRQCDIHTPQALIFLKVDATAAHSSTSSSFGIPCVPRLPLYSKHVSDVLSSH